MVLEFVEDGLRGHDLVSFWNLTRTLNISFEIIFSPLLLSVNLHDVSNWYNSSTNHGEEKNYVFHGAARAIPIGRATFEFDTTLTELWHYDKLDEDLNNLRAYQVGLFHK